MVSSGLPVEKRICTAIPLGSRIAFRCRHSSHPHPESCSKKQALRNKSCSMAAIVLQPACPVGSAVCLAPFLRRALADGAAKQQPLDLSETRPLSKHKPARHRWPLCGSQSAADRSPMRMFESLLTRLPHVCYKMRRSPTRTLGQEPREVLCLLATRAGTAGVSERFGSAAARTPRHAWRADAEEDSSQADCPHAHTLTIHTAAAWRSRERAERTHTAPRGRRPTSLGLGNSTGWFSSKHVPRMQPLLRRLRTHIWAHQW